MSEEKHSLRERLAPMLPKFLMILLILSFWTDRLGMSNTITLLLRFAVFAVVCVLGFVTSSRKKVYGIAIAACAFLLVGHCISCFIVGYQRIVYDLTNFVRVVQMPLFVLCFISFLRANNKCYRAFETGLMLNFWIITASVVVSVLTHTSSATYQSTNVGILGWYSFGNAQSAIMSILAPIVILLCYRRKNFLLFTVTSVAALAQLYLMGTRLAFFSIAVAALGVPVVLVLTGKARTSKRYIAVLVLILIACCATYKQSPMYINQNRYNEAMSYKQNDAERMIKRAEGRVRCRQRLPVHSPSRPKSATTPCARSIISTPRICASASARRASCPPTAIPIRSRTSRRPATARSSSARCCSTSSRSPLACSAWSSAAWPLTARFMTWRTIFTASASSTAG